MHLDTFRDIIRQSIDPWSDDVRLENVVVNEYLTVKEYCSGCISRSFKDVATDMVSIEADPSDYEPWLSTGK